MMSRRFKHRPKRIARRTEREKFDRLVMPAAFICLPVALAILMAAALSYLIYGETPREVMVLGGAVLAVPAALFFYRVVRGHYNDALNEP